MTRTRLFLLAAPVLTMVALVARPTAPAQHAPSGVARQPVFGSTAALPTVATNAARVVDEGIRLEVHPAQAMAPAGSGDVHVELTVSLPGVAQPVSPVDMTVLLDCSGSMSGQKLEQARAAARALVSKLSERDALTIVAFSDAANRRSFSMNESGKVAATVFIDSLSAGGGTNIGLALQHLGGREVASGPVRRAVLISDGEPTVGLTAVDQLVTLGANQHLNGVAITALGVGNEFSGKLMTALADAGGGFYGYLTDAGRLEEVLSKELHVARSVTARNVTLEVVSGLHGQVDIAGRVTSGVTARTVSLPDLRPGDSTQIFSRVRFNEQGASGTVLSARLRWVDLASGQAHEELLGLALPVSSDEADVASSRDEAVFARVVSAFGSEQLVQAAQAYERGDEAQATSLLANARAIFGMSADALAGSEADTRRTETSFRDGSGRRKGASLGLERKKLMDFGKENNSY